MKRHALPWILLAACGRSEPTAEHGDEHAAAAEHEDEPAHGEVPTRVRLPDAVVRDAGIETEAVGRHAIARTVQLPGRVAPVPDREARVAALLPGVVEALPVPPGTAVEVGDPIAIVRAPDLQTLRSDRSALRAQALSARANAERLAKLADQRMASRQEAVAAKAEADALSARARAAGERLHALGLDGRGKGGRGKGPIRFEVRAPMAGVLVERDVVVGQSIAGDDPIGKIANLEQVWFLAHVFERDVVRVREGADADVELNAHPGERFAGTVAYVSHTTDPGAQTLSARIPLDNREGKLRLGLFGTARVEVAPGEAPRRAVLAVPNSAVTRMLGRDVVFVRHPDGDFEVHDVALGRADPHRVEILHGLREGEQVVTQGAFSIKSVLLRDTFGEDHH